jgi:hypothetical protein
MCTEDELWRTSGNEQKIDQDSSSRFADIAARLDKLEKIAALPATPASESANVVARLDKLEKKVTVAAAPASENCWSHDKAQQVGGHRHVGA